MAAKLRVQRDVSSNGRRVDYLLSLHEDAQYFVEMKPRLRALRDLHGAVLQLTTNIAAHESVLAGVLVLVDPTITNKRVDEVWTDLRAILRPEISSRLALVIIRKDTLDHSCGTSLPEIVLSKLVELAVEEASWADAHEGTVVTLPRPKYELEIIKILLNRWFAREPLVSTNELTKLAGCSYPTAAAALERMERYLIRGSRKALGLYRFPVDIWAELVTLNRGSQITMRYADTSGQPRSPKSLLSRLHSLVEPKLAISGTLGAKLWCPTLDVHGVPRLDICVHAPTARVDLGFVSRLDPALERVDDPTTPASVALHLVRRAVSMFGARPTDVESTNTLWADPVECALDLVELRLNEQATALLEHLIAGAKA